MNQESLTSLSQKLNNFKADVQTNLANEIQLSPGYILTSMSIGSPVSLTPIDSDTLNYGIADCSEGDVFIIYGSGESSGRLYTFIDSDNNMVYRSGSNISANGLIVRAPVGASKIIVNTTGYCYIGNTISRKINTLSNVATMAGFDFITNAYINQTGKYVNNASGRYCTDFIPCAENASVEYVGESAHAIVSGLAFYDIEKNFILGYVNNAPNGTAITVTSPEKTAYCRLSTNAATLPLSYVKIPNGSLSSTLYKLINVPEIVYYISPDGNDNTGDGSSSNPFLTVDKALSEGAIKIMVKSGVYEQRINFANAKEHDVTIVSADPTGKAVFIAPGAFVTDSETTVSGYSKVKSCIWNVSLPAGTRLYQDGVEDANTVILDNERNAYQRGQTCRCLDTKIVPCVATTLSDALTEIEAGDIYKYYYDSSNSILYFSRSQEVTAINPIMRSVNTTFIYGMDRSIKLSMYGIESKYMRFDITSAIVHLEDCKCAYAYGSGGFIYGSAIAEFIRCEACGIHGNNTGDGFNAHSSTSGDKHSKQTVASLVDCWSHDCFDDGYSDHERSETILRGGLYEYNGKAGVTPAYGTHCACHNVISRNNYSGFLYLGEATSEEGGKYGQMLCINCLSENNTDISAGSGYGFAVKGIGNHARLIGCKSIGNILGYYAGPQTLMEITDCGALDNITEKKIDGTLTIKNTTIVTV